MNLPTDSEERKKYPLYRGLFGYFPDALALVSRVSYDGSQQHHPDKEMHWDRSKSMDHPDCTIRHLVEGVEANDPYLVAQAAWRALAQCQLMLEQEAEQDG